MCELPKSITDCNAKLCYFIHKMLNFKLELSYKNTKAFFQNYKDSLNTT